MERMITDARFNEIANILEGYEEKHGKDSIPSIKFLWECLGEIREDGTPEPDPDVPEGELDNTIRFLSETKIPLPELKFWAWEAFMVQNEQDEEDRIAGDEYGLS